MWAVVWFDYAQVNDFIGVFFFCFQRAIEVDCNAIERPLETDNSNDKNNEWSHRLLSGSELCEGLAKIASTVAVYTVFLIR